MQLSLANLSANNYAFVWARWWGQYCSGRTRDTSVCMRVRACVCVSFCIHLRVWKGRKLIPVLSDSCVQKPIISWKMTKRWQNIPVCVCVCVWTSITVEIFYPGSRGQGTDSEGRNKIDSQPRRIYLYYFQQHQSSKFYWWQPRDFTPVISVILSYRMFNALFAQSCLNRINRKGEDGI